MLDLGVLGSLQPLNPAQLVTALLPAMTTNVLETCAVQLFLPALPPGGCLVPTLHKCEARLYAYHYHHHDDYFPRTTPTVDLPVPAPHGEDHRLSRDQIDQQSSSVSATCHHSVPRFPHLKTNGNNPTSGSCSGAWGS